MSAASMTPLAYLIPRTDVPVTMGRRVRSVALEREEAVEDGARALPPEERERDMMCIRMDRGRSEKNLRELILETLFFIIIVVVILLG